jgi:hypothetical protein
LVDDSGHVPAVWNLSGSAAADAPVVLSLDHRFLHCVSYSKSANASRRFGYFHMPIFGGWRDYVVLAPTEDTGWYVGWVVPYGGHCGISRIKLRGPVRMLKGPDPTTFFALRASDGKQILIRSIGAGSLGDRGFFSRLPLQ